MMHTKNNTNYRQQYHYLFAVAYVQKVPQDTVWSLLRGVPFFYRVNALFC